MVAPHDATSLGLPATAGPSGSSAGTLHWPVLVTTAPLPPSPLDRRVVLIGLPTFGWLKTLQMRAPSPRMDLRYLVEGLLTVLREQPDRQERWFECARELLRERLSRRAPPWPAAQHRGLPNDVAVDSSHGGTASRFGAGAGAQARTSGHAFVTGDHGPTADPQPLHRQLHPRSGLRTGITPDLTPDVTPGIAPGAPPGIAPGQDPCKALHLGMPTHVWLKRVQASTREPRLEFRFLIEGAVALARQERHWLPQAVGHARVALVEHLALLRHEPITPYFLENLS